MGYEIKIIRVPREIKALAIQHGGPWFAEIRSPLPKVLSESSLKKASSPYSVENVWKHTDSKNLWSVAIRIEIYFRHEGGPRNPESGPAGTLLERQSLPFEES